MFLSSDDLNSIRIGDLDDVIESDIVDKVLSAIRPNDAYLFDRSRAQPEVQRQIVA